MWFVSAVLHSGPLLPACRSQLLLPAHLYPSGLCQSPPTCALNCHFHLSIWAIVPRLPPLAHMPLQTGIACVPNNWTSADPEPPSEVLCLRGPCSHISSDVRVPALGWGLPAEGVAFGPCFFRLEIHFSVLFTFSICFLVTVNNALHYTLPVQIMFSISW